LPFFLSFERTENGKNTVIKNIEDKNFNAYIYGSSTIFTISNSKYFRWNYQQKIIETFDFPSAQPQWNFHLNDLGEFTSESGNKFNYEVENFIGVIDDFLLVLLNQKEILVLNITTGRIKQRLQRIDNFYGQTSIDTLASKDLPFFKTNYSIQRDTKRVIALFEDLLYEIKLEDNQFVTSAYGLKVALEKYKIHPGQLSKKTFFHENRIYFMEQEQGSFGILDIDRNEIEYMSEKIEINGQGLGFDKLKDIQVSSDNVYVLDRTGTLHIFDKA
jgi:hypothetical protein